MTIVTSQIPYIHTNPYCLWLAWMQWIKDQCWQDSTDGAVWSPKKPPRRSSSSEYWYNNVKETSVKYLGVTVDNHLRWHAHIDNVWKGCLGKIAAIRRACHYLPSHIKRTLYLPCTFCSTPSPVLLSGLGQLWDNPFLQTGLCAELRFTHNHEQAPLDPILRRCEANWARPLSQAEGKPLRYCKSTGVLADVPLST